MISNFPFSKMYKKDEDIDKVQKHTKMKYKGGFISHFKVGS